MQKNCPDPCEGSGETEIAKHTLADPVKRFRATTASKKAREQASRRDIIRGLVSAGQSVAETDIPVGRYRADGVRALRQIHRFNPVTTKLFIVNGLWTLSPIGVG